MVRAPWNREIHGEPGDNHRPDRRPGSAQIVRSPRASSARLPEQHASIPRPPILSRQHRHASPQSNHQPTHPSGHDAHRAWLLLRSKREWPHQTDRIAAAGYDSAGLPGPAETAVGDAASRVHAVAPVTIAPITAKTSRTRSDEVVSPERP